MHKNRFSIAISVQNSSSWREKQTNQPPKKTMIQSRQRGSSQSTDIVLRTLHRDTPAALATDFLVTLAA